MTKVYITTIFLTFLTLFAQAQTMDSKPGPIVVCPHGEFTGHHHTPISPEILEKLQNRDDEDPCANITVVYNGFTTAAQNAFQAAVDIWAYSISSTVTIRIDATWTELEEGVLGSAGPTNVFRNFTNAPNSNYYAAALADKIAGSDLSPGNFDISASFNSDFDWYLGTDGNAPNNQYDLVSVVLHEIGHGLGFVSSANYDNGSGTYGLDAATDILSYDPFMLLGLNGSSMLAIQPGTTLGNAFTSNNVYCSSTGAQAANGGTQAKLYAPSQYNGGSSLSHWDENSFPAGNVHSLMTPQIGPGEAIHNPGPITLAFFEDMGWGLCDNTSTGDDCVSWQDPSPTTGWNDFNTAFGGAPCDDGTGCPFNEIQDFEVFASEAYTIDGFLENGQYTFSMCNGDGAGSWTPEFTIIAPSGAIDASGPGTGCAITWTASESGTYLIVINEAGNCGVANTINNGYPALTCIDGTANCNPTDCATGNLQVQGETTLCPEETTTVNMAVAPTVPSGGGFGIAFYNPLTEEGINLSAVTLPYTFDNDLNGLLSANDFDLFEGEYELTGFVYTDPDDASGSICATSTTAVNVTFLTANDPACDENASCATGNLVVTGDQEICPEETTTVNLINAATVPVGGGFGIAFYNPLTEEGINLSAVTLPYTFDNDLNGLLSANDFDLFEGEYELTGFVYTDPDDASGSICATSTTAVNVTFLTANDPACDENASCATGNLVVTGDQEICPEETTTVNLINAATVPVGGGFGIAFYNPLTEEGINLSAVTLPYTFDNDLNGLLSANDFDLFEGVYELTGYVYSDDADPNGTICATSDGIVNVTFYTAEDPECNSIGINERSKGPDFTVFPNPASDIISIKVNVSDLSNLDIQLTDMSGRVIYKTADFSVAGVNLLQANTAKLAQGVYMVLLKSDTGISAKRLVVSR